MARFMLLLFVLTLMIFTSYARSLQEYPMETSQKEEREQNDPEQMNMNKDAENYEQDEGDDEAIADLADMPGQSSELNKRAVCLKREFKCELNCQEFCFGGHFDCIKKCWYDDCEWVCVKYG